ncbi:MAG TPA: peptidoglycan DD-metalloendopeptidase family protein [Candidatus Limnocylindrales bacterium]|nr:peptidoglycan DD-metalloendopeptidase family protein [Candidatus Limnocylindrales bacterium]
MTTFPPAVPKPNNPGQPQMAIVNTNLAYANIRNGPGTNYLDVADMRNLTLAAYYPKAVSQNGWVWVEQSGIGGWVSKSVVTFEHVNAPTPGAQPPTPYKGAVAMWHWKGDSVAENTIEELARTIKTNAPAVKQVWVKTSDYTPTAGAQWMGYWDTKRNLAIDGPSSIDRWVTALAQFGLELHIWVVPRGGDMTAETNLIIQACQRPGVKSLILDVEPYDGFWLGGQAGIRPFMTRIRRALPGSFHIGLAVDSRPHHYETIFPREWQPFVNSVHPMAYWETMRRQPDDVLAEAFEVWGSFGKPIIPALQGDAQAQDMTTAQTLAVARHGAQGLSWWRVGVVGPVEWRVINKPISVTNPPPEPPSVEGYGEEQIVKPRETGFNNFSYTGKNEFSEFQSVYGWTVLYKQTSAQVAQAAARWAPRLNESGKYEVSVFVPARHATTRNARFRVYGVKGSSSDMIIPVDQSIYANQWVTLGVFDFDKGAINGGTVFLNDLTGETDQQIAFDAVRWRKIVLLPGNPGGPIVTPPSYADGFDQPVGTATERRSSQVWAGKWLDASPFGQLYFIGTPSEAYHTGADLNLPADADAHTPVYATASGVVTFAAKMPIWGNLIVVKHDPLPNSSMLMYSRYAHVEEIIVAVGQRVARGQQMARVGNAFGRYAYHLHFDLSPTTILEQKPEHWPGKNRTELLKHYVDPRDFIASHRPR